MELCKGDYRNPHEEICHESGSSCPVCDLQERLDDANAEIGTLETQLDEANSQ